MRTNVNQPHPVPAVFPVTAPSVRRRAGRHAAEFAERPSAARLAFRDASRPTDDQLERMLSRLRSL